MEEQRDGKYEAIMKGTKEKAITGQELGFFSRILKGMHFPVQHTQQFPRRFTRGTPQPAEGKQVT